MTPQGNKLPAIVANSDLAPCLSVVIPVFNEEAIIRELVKCVCAQRPVEEVVIVNDCSTDATGKLVDEIAAANAAVRVVHHPVNQGKASRCEPASPWRALPMSLCRMQTWNMTPRNITSCWRRWSPTRRTWFSGAVSWAAGPRVCYISGIRWATVC